jgi:predicted glycosyltransferase
VRRLLMYSQDGMGLGHLRRSSNIALEVLARDPACNVLILADSPASSLVASRRGIDVLKLPTIVKAGSSSWSSDAWRNGSLTSDVRSVVDLRARLMRETFLEFQPDTVLVDHMPVGALGELKPMLDAAEAVPEPPKLFLGLRDILDSPSLIRRVWTKLDAYAYLDRYDAVFVYGDPTIYDAVSAYQLQPSARRVVYCNYVSPRGHLAVAEPVPDEPFLLMMGGGGRDAFPVARAFLEALPRVSRELDMDAVLLTGPNMPQREREDLVAHARAPVAIRTGFGDAEQWIRSSALVITLGGYNSLCEVMRWRKKALVVPRSGPSLEQRTRSELFARRSLVRVLDPDDLTPERLARDVMALAEDEHVPAAANVPPLDGAGRAAEMLLDGLGAEGAVVSPAPEPAAGVAAEGQEGAHLTVLGEGSAARLQ